MTLVEIIEKWMQEDVFIASHFKIKRSLIGEATINLACCHDNKYHQYDKFVCWIMETTVESDENNKSGATSPLMAASWIRLDSSDPAFFDNLKHLLYDVHKNYSKYCKPKWTHTKK